MNIYRTLLKSKFQFPTLYQIHLMVGELAGVNNTNNRCLYCFDHDGTTANVMIQTRKPIPLDDLGPWRGTCQEMQIPDAEQFGFRIRLTPTICVQGHKKDLVGYIREKNGLTWDESRFEAPNVWFDKRVQHLGFRVDECTVEGFSWAKFTKPDGNIVEFPTLDVAGILRVSDRGQFEKSVTNGIGDERAYGCGLILLYQV